ncbi:MAG: hypothetical protein ABI947_07690 [Chloroflexota bacterium]
MNTFLEKLDRRAKAWLDMVDSQLHDPIVRLLSGELLTHDSYSNERDYHQQPEQQAVQPVITPANPVPHEPDTMDNTRVRRLLIQKANASYKR